jgi:hypothetical protein
VRPADPTMTVPAGFVPVARDGAWTLLRRGCA